MKLTREELLRQRALVEEQLRWIDAKLAETPSESDVSQSLSQVFEPSESSIPQSQPIVGENAQSPVLGDIQFASDGSAEGVTTGQKIGCFVLVIIFCLGVLGMIFVLPYLLY